MNLNTQKLEERVRPPETSALPALAERQTGWAARTWQRIKLSPTTPIFVALILVCIVLSVLSERFFRAANILNILNQSAIVGIAAVGATLVIITAGIDLSVGSNIALSGMVAATFVAGGGDGVLGVILALLISTLIGAFNGASVAWLNLAPFIVTLATLGMGRGLTLQLSQGQSVYDLPESFNWIGSATVLGIPFASVLTVLMFIVGHLILNNTVFGHKVYATGGNREAARLSGIKDRQTLFFVYGFAGLCAGISAVVLVGRLGSATPTAGTGLELQVIAAVVIGGTSLFGGKGSMLGTFIGVLLIGVINNGLTLLNVSPFWVQFVQAAMIFLAVLLDSFNTRRLARRKVKAG
ncbi:ABC transporter permease [Leucobacter ruminantium]|uniref:ABC transporter permease n=1 Tax=Leucobacter ruminantium TaxID=1289170 RepID=A0A939LTD2_9MICO|nr:ABC transporter permease [Leucobacter ruminantium]MBO1804379.1 ABC transporter permease [Leucobacter ruminantium]